MTLPLEYSWIRPWMKRPLSPSILRVPITARSLERCLTDLMTPQPIDGRRCSQCSNVSSEIATQILATPQAIAIQLLRFQQGSEVTKNTATVTLKPVVRLAGASWHLTGIVNHMGTLNQGHYTAHICHQQHWFRCDDSREVETTAEAAFSFSDRSAYIIFLSKA